MDRDKDYNPKRLRRSADTKVSAMRNLFRSRMSVGVLAFAPNRADRMSAKPVIFTISAAWDEETSVWTGHSDDIPAAADAPTLDELLAKISAMAIDLLPDNHPDVDPANLYLQITALREAEPAAA